MGPQERGNHIRILILSNSVTGPIRNPGILMLSLQRIFNVIKLKSGEKNYQVRFSYLDIYNELIHDLLSKDPSAVLDLREDPIKGVSVAGLCEILIDSPETALKLIASRAKPKITENISTTQYSSRSHNMFQIIVEHSDKCAGIEADVKVGKLSLIDLAGSERTARGVKLPQGTNITRSLLALGNCINRLSAQMSKGFHAHIPYRESKLTRLLKDSLGGNCRTLMIGNISPSNISYQDTYNTLKYATRARNIKTNIQKNVVNVQFHVSQYDQIIGQLRKEILMLKEQIVEPPSERPMELPDKIEEEELILDHPEDIEPTLEEIKKHYKNKTIIRKKLYMENQRLELLNLGSQFDDRKSIESIQEVTMSKKELETKLEEINNNENSLNNKIKKTSGLSLNVLRKQMNCEKELVEKIPIEARLESRKVGSIINFQNTVITKLKEQLRLRDNILKRASEKSLETKNNEVVNDSKGAKYSEGTEFLSNNGTRNSGPLQFTMGKDLLHKERKPLINNISNQRLSRNQSQFSQEEDLAPYSVKEAKNEKRSGSVVYKINEQGLDKRQKMLKKNYLLSANKELIKIYRGGSKINKQRNLLNNKSVRLQDAGSQIVGGYSKVKSERPNCSIQLNNVKPLNLMKLKT